MIGLLSGSALRRRLLSGGAWAAGGKVGASVLGLVTNFALLHLLTPPEYVVYGLAFTIITVGVVIGSMGLPKTVVQFVAENMALNQSGRARRAISLVLGLGVFGALGASLAYFLVADIVGNLLNSPALVALTGLMAGWIAISVVQEITAETFRGFHDIRLATLLGGLATGGKSGGLIMRVLLLGGLVWLWLTSEDGKTDLRAVMLVSVGAGVASGLLAGWLLYGKMSSLSTQGTVENPMSAKDVLRDAFPFVIISLTSFVLLSASDLWILTAVLPTKAEVAPYLAATKLVTFIAMPLLIANLVLPPIIAEMYARGQTNRLERTVRSFSTLAGVPSLLLLLSFMFLGGPLLVFFSGEALYRSGWAVLVILSLGKLVAVWSGSCGAVLQFTGHQISMLRVSLLTGLFFVVGALLVVYLLPREYIPEGVAAMTAVTAVVQNVRMVLVARRKTGMWTQVMFSLSPFRKVLSR
ncbi:MAG: oligosaccharide flippase family protein [Rubrobacteraceae bacterium]|nr:oligosaccharide flippase family protein [Rubrobacteraceae bacterium]